MQIYERIADAYPVREVLRRYGVRFAGTTAYHCLLPGCAGHEAVPAGSLYRGKDGRERWKCHRCGPDVSGDSLDFVERLKGLDRQGAVKELTGRTVLELFREWKGPTTRTRPERRSADNRLDVTSFPPDLDAKFKPGRSTPEVRKKDGTSRAYLPDAVYRYLNGAGETTLIMLRMVRQNGSKLPLPVRYVEGIGCVAAGWQAEEVRQFYGGLRLLRRPSDPVLVVEGEKCVDLLSALPQFDDYVVITWQGGTGNVRHQPWDRLINRTVVFWPDADKVSPERLELDPEAIGAGEKAMRYAADKVGGDRLSMVNLDEAWIDRDIGYDACDLVHDIGADAARAEFDARLLPYQPPPPPGEEPPDPPQHDRDGQPIDYILIGTGVRRGLKRNEPSNWGKYIDRDPRFGHALTFDVVTRTILCDGTPLEPDSRRFHDLVHELGTVGPWHSLHEGKVGRYVSATAKCNPVNRVLDAIRTVPWDGQRRVLAGYLVAEPDAWAEAACTRWLLGLTHRVLEPGWKHDGMLVLEGKQGRSKTSFFRTMGHIHGFDLYGDLSKLVQERDVQKQLAGKVVVELGEMTAVRAGRESLKAMLTAQEDEYREFYETGVKKYPRTCVFGGTTNDDQYLPDTTGNRRYWIVPIDNEARLDDLERDLPQLLAQALTDVEQSVQNWLTGDEETMQEAVAATREIEDPMFDDLEKELAGDPRKSLSRHDIFQLLNIGREKRPSNERCKLLSAKLRRLGWTYQAHSRRWFRPPEPVEPDDDSDIPL